jgi:hypothetical protein
MLGIVIFFNDSQVLKVDENDVTLFKLVGNCIYFKLKQFIKAVAIDVVAVESNGNNISLIL